MHTYKTDRFFLLMVTFCAGLVGWTGRFSAIAHAHTELYVAESSEFVYYKGYQTPPADWIQPAFTEDGLWLASTNGFSIGYGDGDDNTLLTDMQGNYLTVYVRVHFQGGSEIADLTYLALTAWFDDGFVAYLNGQEIARSHVPAGALSADDPASGHEVSDGEQDFTIDPALLNQGDNVLAAEIHNASLASSDLSFLPVLWGYDTPPPEANIIRGPFLQQVDRNSVIVVWETDLAADSRVIFGPTQEMEHEILDPDPKTRHRVVLTGLAPNSTQYYEVQSAYWPSGMGRFYTERDLAEPYRVAVFGDTRSNHQDHRNVSRALIAANPHLAFHTGDLVGDGDEPIQWDTFLDVESQLMFEIPLYPALGNHEGSGDLYVDVFDLPSNTPSPERYYVAHYATALFIVLDQYTNAFSIGSPQYNWLEGVLSATASDPSIFHRIVLLHHGPFDSGPHGSNMTVRDNLTPLFEQHGVDIVFTGHDHCYERSTVEGVKYVVTGGGGAPLYSPSGAWWTEVAESVLHYCLLDIHGPLLAFEARRLDGTVLDSFVLGDDYTECEHGDQCQNHHDHSDCPPGETGAWACVQRACLWNCTQPPAVEPDAAVPDGHVPQIDAAVPIADGGVDAQDSANRQSGGCGCRQPMRQPGRAPMTLFWLLLGTICLFVRIVAAGLWRRAGYLDTPLGKATNVAED
jgi:predicted phosphodiesterase